MGERHGLESVAGVRRAGATSAPDRGRPKWAATLLKAAVSAGVLLFLLARIDLSRLMRVLGSVDVSYLAVAVLAYFAGQLLKCLRWARIARLLGFHLPLREFFSYYFIGMFFSLFAPGIVGGDLSRVLYLAGSASEKPSGSGPARMVSATVSVVLDRGVGVAVLVWIGAVALVLFPQYDLPRGVRYLTVALALGVLAGWAVLVSLPGVVARLFSRRIELFVLIARGLRDGRTVYGTLILSLLVHCIQAGIQALLGFALHVALPWSYCFILYPLVDLSSALPVSLNGIGLREGGYLFLLDRVGVGAEQGVAVGLLWFFSVAVNGLLGGVVFVLRGAAREPARGGRR
jgi:uncharacterized membrane protein YbhN (UPF0104 family)